MKRWLFIALLLLPLGLNAQTVDTVEEVGVGVWSDWSDVSDKTDTVFILNDLKTAVSEIENSEAWLMVTKQVYTSGAPSVRLTATANEDDSQRSCVVTIIAASTDKVLLTVTQEKEKMLTGIDNQHDIVTDQPASSR